MRPFIPYALPPFKIEALHFGSKTKLTIGLGVLCALVLAFLLWDYYREWRRRRRFRRHWNRKPGQVQHVVPPKAAKRMA